MKTEHFFKDSRLPFAECRYTRSSVRVFKPHMHRTFSIGAVNRGRVRYEVSGREAVLEVGALAVINSEVMHSCNSLDPEGRSYYMLYLDMDWCRKVQESLWQVSSFVAPWKIMIDDRDLYDKYCQIMRVLMNGKEHLLKKEQLLVGLASEVFERVCSPQEERKELDGSIDFLKEKLGSCLREDISLVSLAEELDANPYTLLRKFKAETGITPHVYRMNCRIEKAREYLRQGTDIGEVALECGFFDQSHLHRYFKAVTTVTPKEYQVNFLQ